MSTGLFTAPGNYARSKEMLALAGVLRQHGATYASHIRDEANLCSKQYARLLASARVPECGCRSLT